MQASAIRRDDQAIRLICLRYYQLKPPILVTLHESEFANCWIWITLRPSKVYLASDSYMRDAFETPYPVMTVPGRPHRLQFQLMGSPLRH